MTLLIREADVRGLLTMRDAISGLESAFRALGSGEASNRPRQRVRVANGVLHVMPAGLPRANVLGLKAYSAFRTGTRFLVLLYGADTGELLALIEADALGQVRTGAATGLATRYLARQDARRVVVFGSGRQARAQLAAVAEVRQLESALVFSRNPEHVRAFCDEMSARLSFPVQAGRDSMAAVGEADVIITMTTAREPVLNGSWLQPGVHVNAAGSNYADRREVDAEVIRRSDVIAVDSAEQARQEAGDLLLAEQEGALDWSRVVELGSIVAGRKLGRQGPEQLTLFKSIGLAVEDMAAANIVYQRACEAGIGTEIPLFASLQGRS